MAEQNYNPLGIEDPPVVGEVPPIAAGPNEWVCISMPIETDNGRPTDDPRMQTPDPVWQGMTREQFQTIGSNFRWLADRLGLRDWAFNFRWEPCEDESAQAAIKVIEGQKRATFWVCKEFATLPDHDQLHALVHELLHCHFDALSRMVWSLQVSLGEPTFRVFERNFDAQIENAVDAIAAEVAVIIGTSPEYKEG